MKRTILLAVLISVQVALWCVRYYDGIDINGDNAAYLALGQSLATGNGYRVMWHPDNHKERVYPAGLPLLLAGCHKLFGPTLLPPKLLMLGLALLSTVLVLHLFGWPVAVATALSWHVAVWSGTVMSETPFMFSYLLAIWVIRKGTAGPWGALAIVCAFLPASFRSLGLVFIPYFAAVCISEKRWLSLITTGAFTLLWLASPWLGTTGYADSYGLVGENTRTATQQWLRVLNGIRFQSTFGLSRMVLPQYRNLSWMPYVGLPFAVLMLTGVWVTLRWRLQHRLLLIFSGLCALAILAWEPGVGIRYMAPLWPLIIHYTLLPIETKPSIRWARWVLVVALVGCQIFSLFLSPNKLSPDWKRFRAANFWCRSNLPEGSVIISRKPTITWWWTGHKAQTYPFRKGPEVVWDSVRVADAIIVDRLPDKYTHRFLIPALLWHTDSLEVLHEAGNTLVVRVTRADN